MNVLGMATEYLNAFLFRITLSEREMISVVATENICQLDFPSNDINSEDLKAFCVSAQRKAAHFTECQPDLGPLNKQRGEVHNCIAYYVN